MSKAQTKFTVRMAPEALAQIDVLRAQHGFSSRAAFLDAAGLAQRMGSTSDSEVLYRRMVDENLVRKSVSFAEMANLARSYAIDPRVVVPGAKEAIRILFASAGKQKRSYTRSFASLLDLLDKWLERPEEIPRALGLQLRQWISDVPGVVGALTNVLKATPNRAVRDELRILRRFAGGDVVERKAGALWEPPYPTVDNLWGKLWFTPQ